MAVALTYGTLNLNSGAYTVLEGIDFGEEPLSFDEYRGLDGSTLQTNVSRAGIIEVRIPLRIKATTLANFEAAVKAINDEIATGDLSLVYNGGGGNRTYACVASKQLNIPEVLSKLIGLTIDLELVLNRKPGYS